MKVTIMYRNNYHGGDGWTYYPMTITIGDNCPRCGCPRGEPRPNTYCEDGEWYTVDNWTNQCGHIDQYRDCYHEALRLIEGSSTNQESNHAMQ